MSKIEEMVVKDVLDREDLIQLLSAQSSEEIEEIRAAAESVLLRECGDSVYFRGLIEFSNICRCDCCYCGIRKSNASVKRYMLDKEDVLSAAKWCADKGYGSIVLQSGERTDAQFIDYTVDVLRKIKENTRSGELPEGLGITLCVGEQTFETYRRFFEAGAHRYLLRIETSSPVLFSAIHPSVQTLTSRVNCLKMLKEIGYQIGTGVMIGLPGQTVEDLADDILFFREINTDMIGMGPYIAHSQTPMCNSYLMSLEQREAAFLLSLKMIAAVRLALKDVNIAATTALQALRNDGREQGLRFGANVIMPQLTPIEVKKDYLLYEGKPCLDESADQCGTCLAYRVESASRRIEFNKWGDSRHFINSKHPN